MEQQYRLNVDVDSDGITILNLVQKSESSKGPLVKTLSEDEGIALLYIYDKELLSFRINVLMDLFWPGTNFFRLAAAKKSHLSLVLALIAQNLTREEFPDGGKNRFVDPGLNRTVISLTTNGKKSEVDALIAATSVEENAAVELGRLRSYLGNHVNVYTAFQYLAMASRNHIRSLVSSLSELGHLYEPTHMSAKYFKRIIERPYEETTGSSDNSVLFESFDHSVLTVVPTS